MTDENKRRAKVTVNCTVPNGVTIACHHIHEGFMGQKTRVPIGDMVTLKNGANPGIDKEWFDAWLKENENLSIVTTGMVSAVDERDPEDGDEPAAEHQAAE